jgi:hypothetical protein
LQSCLNNVVDGQVSTPANYRLLNFTLMLYSLRPVRETIIAKPVFTPNDSTQSGPLVFFNNEDACPPVKAFYGTTERLSDCPSMEIWELASRDARDHHLFEPEAIATIGVVH